MKVFSLEWGIHCEFLEAKYGQGETWSLRHAHYTLEFAKWLKENNIKVALHNLEIMPIDMGDPWIIFKSEEDEMFFKLRWT